VIVGGPGTAPRVAWAVCGRGCVKWMSDPLIDGRLADADIENDGLELADDEHARDRARIGARIAASRDPSRSWPEYRGQAPALLRGGR